MPKFQAPKGTRDFYPERMALRNWIADVWRRVSVRNGFVEYDGPTFESLDLYRVKSGDEIVEQLFHFQDRGGRAFALRPEMTPTLARMVAARAQELPKPIKWFCIPAMFRGERPQRGRLREFIQWNIDIIGEDTVIADAECIFTVVDLFREMGLTSEQVSIKISSRALLAAILLHQGFAETELGDVFAVLDKRDKLPDDIFVAQVKTVTGGNGQKKTTLLAIGDAKGDAGLDSVAQLVGADPAASAELERVRQLLDCLAKMGVSDFCRFDMGVVRGLAYYTGVVFEAFGAGGLGRAICGGGRYDQLIESLGGPSMGCVGCAISDVVVEDLLTEFDRLPRAAAGERMFLIDAEPDRFPDVLALAADLRSRGVTALFSYKRQSLGKQLRQASGRGAKRVVIVDRDTVRLQRVGVKDMQSGAQVQWPIDRWLVDPWQPIPDDAAADNATANDAPAGGS